MTLAFRLTVAPRTPARRLALAAHLLGAAGAALGIVFLWRSAGAPVALCAGAPALVLLAASWLATSAAAARARPGGTLVVSADGGARWCPPDAPAGRPFAPMRWQAFGGIVCLDGECDGRGLALLTSAPARGSPELDRLSAWLRWLDRGGPAVAAPAGTCIPAVRPHLPRT